MVRDNYRHGGFGMLVVAILASIHFILDFLAFLGLFPMGLLVPLSILFYVVSIGLLFALIFAGLGFLRLHKTMNLKWGQVAYLFPIIFSWMFLSYEIYNIVLQYFNWLYLILLLFLPFGLPRWLLSPIGAYYFTAILKYAFLGIIVLIWSKLLFQSKDLHDQSKRASFTAWLFLMTGITFLSLILVRTALTISIEIYFRAFANLLLSLGCIQGGLFFLNLANQKPGY
jgi:hypothetical protein